MPRAVSGATAATMAQYGCPTASTAPSAVARAPATPTATTNRTGCQVQAGANRVGRETCRRSSAPALPTSRENSTLATQTAAATGTSPGWCGAEDTAPNANTRNSGPGGCQSWTEDSSVPSPATTQQPATASQSRESAEPASTPSTTETVRAAPALACMAALDRCTWLRP